jgi:hypothetical protein
MKYRFRDVEYGDFATLKPVLAKEVGVDPQTPHGLHGRTFGQDHPVTGSGYVLFMPQGGWTPGGSPHQFTYATADGVRVVVPV